jgi:hypothetical protein
MWRIYVQRYHSMQGLADTATLWQALNKSDELEVRMQFNQCYALMKGYILEPDTCTQTCNTCAHKVGMRKGEHQAATQCDHARLSVAPD